MEIAWLQTFLAVVEHGGFTAASAEVHRSQSRVSAHIAALEKSLASPLFDRTHRPARLTEAGAVFRQHARLILDEVGAARRSLAMLQGGAVSLTIETTADLASGVLPCLLATVRSRHPQTRLTVRVRDRIDGDTRDLDDSALLLRPTLESPLPSGLDEQVLWREALQVLLPAGHELHGRGPVDPRALVGRPLVIVDEDAGAALDVAWGADPRTDSHQDVTGPATDPRIVAGSAAAAAEMVRAGLGIGVLWAVAAARTDLSGLHLVDVDDPDLVREVAAYWDRSLGLTEAGRALHATVMAAAPPPGAVEVGRP